MLGLASCTGASFRLKAPSYPCVVHVVSIESLTGEIIVGELPRRQLRLVQAWTELHADELKANWELAASEYPLNPIDPLR
jgi:Domain of unknown function (DUF4160)